MGAFKHYCSDVARQGWASCRVVESPGSDFQVYDCGWSERLFDGYTVQYHPDDKGLARNAYKAGRMAASYRATEADICRAEEQENSNMSAQYNYEKAFREYDEALKTFNEKTRLLADAKEVLSSRFPDEPKDGTVLKYRAGLMNHDQIRVAYRDDAVWYVAGSSTSLPNQYLWGDLKKVIGIRDCWIGHFGEQVKQAPRV